jgi:DNA-binding NtrC family response regulator
VSRPDVQGAHAADPAHAADDPRIDLELAFRGREQVLGELLPRLERVADADLPVLIEGPPGAGKTLAARVVHARGVRRRGGLEVWDARPWAARRAPLAELLAADTGGSLILLEVGALTAPAQEALLASLRLGSPTAPRVLATSSDEGLSYLAPDLRARLSVLRLRVPGLRETPAAVSPLLEALGAGPIDEQAAALLRRHPWTQNLAEARRAATALAAWRADGPVDRPLAVRLLDALGSAADAPAPGPAAQRGTLDELEAAAIAGRLEALGWHQVHTAASLGIDRKTLYRKIRRYGLRPPSGPGPGPPDPED